jgi:hypothetical protein
VFHNCYEHCRETVCHTVMPVVCIQDLMDLNSKQRKVLNGGSITLSSLALDQ